jgi:acyl-CoA reductase-like NAD-dependent aldehyde dehydrogenase
MIMDRYVIARGLALRHPDKLFIDGEWVTTASSSSLDVVSARDESVIATVAEESEAHMDRVVAAARGAFDEGEWPRLSPEQRGEWLHRRHAVLVPRVPELVNA